MESENSRPHDTVTPLLQLHPKEFSHVVDSTETSPPPSVLFSKRLFVAILLFFGYVTVALCCQVSNIAVLEMTSSNHTPTTTTTTASPTPSSSSGYQSFLFESTQFQWDTMTVGTILNMFWYGCLFTPIGGVLAHKFGGSVTMGVSSLLAAVTVLLSPIALRIHLYLYLACRGLVGLFEGFACASCALIFAHWIPKRERSMFVSSIMNGFYFGNAFTFILCGYLAQRWGWPMAFYGAGALVFIWSLLWLYLVANDPAEDKTISQTELTYIKKETGDVSSMTNNDRPFRAILTSPPFWALTSCKFAYGWCQTFAVGYCPTFIKDATNKNINTIGYLSSIPNIADIFVLPLAGLLLSSVQKRTALKDNTIYKSILCIGFVICSAAFTLITATNYFIVSMACLVLINTLISYDRIVYELITVNMAPNHTSLVSGISLFGQNSGNIIAQIFIGYVVRDHTLPEWNTCFLWSAGVMVFIALSYFIFGSSEPQPWSMSSTSRRVIQDKLNTKNGGL